MRAMVASASGRMARMPYLALMVGLSSKIDGQGSDQSMIVAAATQGFSRPNRTASPFGSPYVGVGQAIGFPSRRAIQ